MNTKEPKTKQHAQNGLLITNPLKERALHRDKWLHVDTDWHFSPHVATKLKDPRISVSHQQASASDVSYLYGNRFLKNILARQPRSNNPLTRATPIKNNNSSSTSWSSIQRTLSEAWKNPYIANVISQKTGSHEKMLQTFLQLYREIELQDIKRLTPDKREEPLNRVRQQIQQEISRLKELPTNGDAAIQKQVSDLQNVLIKGQANEKEALEMAKTWLSRPVDKLQGNELLTEVKSQFNISNVPAWAQPLILDLSGLRYASAHGTWRPPQQLLFIIAKNEKGKDFAKSDEAKSIKKNLQELSNEQALNELQAMYDQKKIPEAAWHQIVRRTDLRLNTKQADWDKDPPKGSLDTTWGRILKEWQVGVRGWSGGGATAWRAELMRRNALVVTQMVCNELAEAAQRQRNIKLPGGIAGNSEWFRRHTEKQEKKVESSVESSASTEETAAEERPFFKHGPTVSPTDLRPGASIFFLCDVSDEWSGANKGNKRPGGHALVRRIPEIEYPIPWKGNKAESGYRPTISEGAIDEEGWEYHLNGSEITRTREKSSNESKAITVSNTFNEPEKITQWLTWRHQTTLLQVAGSYVIMFETTENGAGVKKRPLTQLQSQFVFVGWAPEGTK